MRKTAKNMAPCRSFVCSLILSYFLTTLAISNSIQQQGVYRHGDVILGGLFPIHLRQVNDKCTGLRPEALVWSEAMILAIETINRNSSFLPNITLGYDIQDTCGTEQVAISSAAQFSFINNLMYNERYRSAVHACSNENTTHPSIVAVLGGEDSRVSVNIANVLQLGGIPQISYGSTSAQLSNKNKFRTFFRTVPSDEFQSEAIAQIIKSSQWSCVAVIGTDDIYGRSGVDAFVYSAKQQNICIALRELFPVYDVGGQTKALVRKLKLLSHVEIIILYSLPAQAIKIFEESLKQKMFSKTWFASDGWAESAYIRQKQFIPVIQGTIGLEFRDIHFDLLTKHLKNITSNSHQEVWWEEFWKTQFNCSTGRSPNDSHLQCSGREQISPDFYKKNLHTPLSAYVVDAVLTVANALKLMQNCSGRRCSNVSDVTPEQMVQAIKRTSFVGLTGDFDFSKPEKQARYDIINLQVNNAGGFESIEVGKWDNKQLQLNYSALQWRNGLRPQSTCGMVCPKGTYKSGKLQCKSECVHCSGDTYTDVEDSTQCIACAKGFVHSKNHTSCTEALPIYIKWNDSWGIAMLFVNCVGILSNIIVLFITLKNYKTPVITETGGFLNVALIAALFLAFGFNFVLLSTPSDARCSFLAIWFYIVYPGSVLIFFLKIHFIKLCFDKKQDPSTSESPGAPQLIWRYYLAATAAALIPAVISVIWVAQGNLQSSKILISREIVYATCSSLDSHGGKFLQYINIIYLYVMTVGTTVYSHRMKKIVQSQKFRESKHLFYAMSVFLITLTTFYPGWVLIQGPVLQVFACSTNIIAATGVTLCVYGPKLHLILLYPVLNTYAHIHPVRTSVMNAAVNMGLQLVDTGLGRTITFLDDSTLSDCSPEGPTNTLDNSVTPTPPVSSCSNATDA